MQDHTIESLYPDPAIENLTFETAMADSRPTVAQKAALQRMADISGADTLEVRIFESCITPGRCSFVSVYRPHPAWHGNNCAAHIGRRGGLTVFKYKVPGYRGRNNRDSKHTGSEAWIVWDVYACKAD